MAYVNVHCVIFQLFPFRSTQCPMLPTGSDVFTATNMDGSLEILKNHLRSPGAHVIL